MGFISDFVENTGNAWDDLTGAITGRTAAEASTAAGRDIAEAARRGAGVQVAAGERAQEEIRAGREAGLGFLDPFGQLGQRGIEQAGFLTDPQAQFDFLQNNPLFAAALERAGTQTQNIAAARGRLSAGDTLQQLSENVLLSASPLIQQQKQSIGDLLNLGFGTAQQQAGIETGAASDIANLITSGGAAEAAGIVGAANALAQGRTGAAGARGGAVSNLIGLGGLALGGLPSFRNIFGGTSTPQGSISQSVFAPGYQAPTTPPQFRIAGIT